MKRERKLLSLVVAVRNRDETLRYLLSSLSRQTLRADLYEIMLVDYGGQPSTRKLVSEFGLPNLRYVYIKEYGVFNESHSKNIGIKRAVGEWVAVVNADIVLPFDLLKRFYDLLRQTPKKRHVYQIRRFDLAEEDEPQRLIEFIKQGKGRMGSVQDKTACGDFQAAHREDWRSCRGYDEKMTGWGAMDLDIVERMKIAGVSQKWLSKREYWIYHLYHPTKAVNRAKINLLLMRMKKGVWVNHRWGERKRKVKAAVIGVGRGVSKRTIAGLETVFDQVLVRKASNPEELAKAREEMAAMSMDQVFEIGGLRLFKSKAVKIKEALMKSDLWYVCGGERGFIRWWQMIRGVRSPYILAYNARWLKALSASAGWLRISGEEVLKLAQDYQLNLIEEHV